MKKTKKKTKRVRRDHLTVEGRAAYDLISKDPRYAVAAKVLKNDIVKLHKVHIAMTKKNAEAVQLAWRADR